MAEKEVKDELGKSDLEKRADELSVGRTGEVTENEGISESPIAEARRLSKSLKEQMDDMKTERKRLEELMSSAVLSGKSLGSAKPKEMTQDEIDQIKANEIVKNFIG